MEKVHSLWVLVVFQKLLKMEEKFWALLILAIFLISALMIVVWNCKGSACISLYRGEEEGGGPYHIFVFFMFICICICICFYISNVHVCVYFRYWIFAFICVPICVQFFLHATHYGGRGRERLTCQACTSLTGKLYFQIFLICVFASGFSFCVFVSF